MSHQRVQDYVSTHISRKKMPLSHPIVTSSLKTLGFGLCPHAKVISEGVEEGGWASDLCIVLFLLVLSILKVGIPKASSR